ncbi:MAG: hypothetical protein LBR26_09805 [Prevotella sp.]|nr:hypothetical protein [Prevotella sp.]
MSKLVKIFHEEKSNTFYFVYEMDGRYDSFPLAYPCDNVLDVLSSLDGIEFETVSHSGKVYDCIDSLNKYI